MDRRIGLLSAVLLLLSLVGAACGGGQPESQPATATRAAVPSPTGTATAQFPAPVERWRVAADFILGEEGARVSDCLVTTVQDQPGVVACLDPATGAERWRVSLGADGGPTVDPGDGVVYVGVLYATGTPAGGFYDAARLLALDPTTGAERWNATLAGAGGVFGADAESVYVAAASPIDGVPGVVQALDARTGVERWRVAIPRHQFGGRSLMIPGGLLYVPGYEMLHALDPATGAERWSFRGEVDTMTAIGDTLYVWTATGTDLSEITAGAPSAATLHALDPATGTERWRAEMGDVAPWKLLTLPNLVSGAVVVGVFEANLTTVVALDPASGAERWRVGLEGSGHDLAATDRFVYANVTRFDVNAAPSPDEGIIALDAGTGVEAWRFVPPGALGADDLLLGGGGLYASAMVLSGERDSVYALDEATGTERWRLVLAPEVSFTSFEAFGDGVVYVLAVASGDAPNALFALDAPARPTQSPAASPSAAGTPGG